MPWENRCVFRWAERGTRYEELWISRALVVAGAQNVARAFILGNIWDPCEVLMPIIECPKSPTQVSGTYEGPSLWQLLRSIMSGHQGFSFLSKSELYLYKHHIPSQCQTHSPVVEPTSAHRNRRLRMKNWKKIAGPVFSYKLRYIVGLVLVEMAISTNPKPTIYRNLHENIMALSCGTDNQPWGQNLQRYICPITSDSSNCLVRIEELLLFVSAL